MSNVADTAAVHIESGGKMPRDSDRPANFHSGELTAQIRAGQTAEAEWLGPVVKPFLAEGGRSLIKSAHIAVATTIGRNGAPVLSLLAADAGAFGALGSSGLMIPRAAVSPADSLFGNLQRDRRIGLVYLDPHTRRRFRVNGEVVDSRTDPLEVSILEAFPNCKKYLVRQQVATAAQAPAKAATQGRSITRAAAALLCRASLVFVGSANPQGQLDAATRSGDPGFIREVERNTFEIPDFAGNAMYQTIGNLLLEPRVSIGLIDGDEFLVLTGSSTTHWEEGAERSGGNGRFWRFMPRTWRRVPLPVPVELSGQTRCRHTPVLD
ncbi:MULTISPECIES: pyridoxamine 5'-phosphate oxidase family protein [unclassified Streptomyces]|uniref:pyridoxamine 5'-phosphate oxidase family protein n=1 Tax=unclassified Streptomyces TaxID=2593676 RepID=UPI001160EFBC|nr:pyridoxamine 5'-phosphate oxidase family protein [Streptomyces sp. NBRC 110465]